MLFFWVQPTVALFRAENQTCYAEADLAGQVWRHGPDDFPLVKTTRGDV